MNNQKLKQRNSSQSEPAPTKARPWMDGVWRGHFFSLGSFSPANLPIAESSRSVPRVQGFKNWDSSKWMVSKRKTRVGLFVGAGSHWVWWESKRPLTALQVSEPKTSVGRVFDFFLVIPAGSGVFKVFRTKEPPVPGIWKRTWFK